MSTDAPDKAGLLLPPHMKTTYCLQPRHLDDCAKARCSVQGNCPAVCYAVPVAVKVGCPAGGSSAGHGHLAPILQQHQGGTFVWGMTPLHACMPAAVPITIPAALLDLPELGLRLPEQQ